MTRDPEWDERAREWALADAHYRRMQCPTCGTHDELGSDDSVIRNVEKVKRDTCLDCEAIDGIRNQYHQQQAHTDERCDCDDYVFYVDRYLPRPPGGV